MKIKTQDLIGPALDWAVATCLAQVHDGAMLNGTVMHGLWISGLFTDPNYWIRVDEFSPSTRWSQGGPIIEREGIDVFTEKKTPESWVASIARYQNGGRLVGWRIHQYGPTPLIAAMRAYVVSKLGDEAEIPEELLK